MRTTQRGWERMEMREKGIKMVIKNGQKWKENINHVLRERAAEQQIGKGSNR